MRCLKEKFNLLTVVIELFDIGDATRKFEFSLAPEAIDLEQENARLIDAAVVTGELKKGIAQTDVKGEIRARVAVECARCLQPVEKDLEISFAAVFVQPEDLTPEEKETQLTTTDLDVSTIENDKIDLNEIVREQIILNTPDQTFCREDCQGLCDQCGANRNVVNCKCRENEIDPRWNALRNLKNMN